MKRQLADTAKDLAAYIRSLDEDLAEPPSAGAVGTAPVLSRAGKAAKAAAAVTPVPAAELPASPAPLMPAKNPPAWTSSPNR